MRMTGAVCSMQLSAHLHRSASTVVHYIGSYITTCLCSVIVDHGLVMLRSLHILEKLPSTIQRLFTYKNEGTFKRATSGSFPMMCRDSTIGCACVSVE